LQMCRSPSDAAELGDADEVVQAAQLHELDFACGHNGRQC
jgi:hypothetical protein